MAKLFISKKQIVKMSEFLENYLSIKYDGTEKMTHKNIEIYLREKNIFLTRVNMDKVEKEDLLKGNYVVVMDASHRKLVYKNPRKDLNELYKELSNSVNKYRMEKARKEVLNSLGLMELNNMIIKKEETVEEEYQLENNNRQKQFVIKNRSYYRKRHY